MKKFAILFAAGILLSISAKIAFAAVQLETNVRLDPVVIDDTVEFWAELDEDGNVYMDWSKYAHSEPFTFYKIVRTQENNNPIYPADGYIWYTESIDELTYTDTEVPDGVSFYRVCQIAEPKRYCSAEVQKIVKGPLKLNPEMIAARETAVKPGALLADKIAPVEITGQGEAATTESAATATGDMTRISTDKLRKIQDAAKVAANKPDSSKPSSLESFFSEYWVQFLALIVSLIGVALAVTGFTVAGAKKKKSVSKFIHQIDDTFASFKWKSKRCEAELYRLHDLIDDRLKEGKIDESAYHLLNSRIDKYLAEIKEIDNLPPHLKDKT